MRNNFLTDKARLNCLACLLRTNHNTTRKHMIIPSSSSYHNCQSSPSLFNHSLALSNSLLKCHLYLISEAIKNTAVMVQTLGPLPYRALQTIGLTSAAILAGQNFTLTFYAIPAVLLAPTDLAVTQYARIFNLGKKLGPALALTSFLSFTYLAFDSHLHFSNTGLVWSPLKSVWKGYLTAGALAVSIVPYTFVAMMGTNKKLLEEAERVRCKESLEAKGGENKQVGMAAATAKQLLDQWGTLNLVRGVLPLAGAVIGAWTALK